MRRREVMAALAGAAAWPLAARAQQPIPVVGFLNSASAEGYGSMAAGFRDGLADVGYREGNNVAIEHRWADNQYERLPALAAELVDRRMAVIFANSPSVSAAKAATSTIPIVFLSGDDPVRLGLVASLNRPGGNVTGVAILSRELAGKRLALLHELVPNARTIAVLINSDFVARLAREARLATACEWGEMAASGCLIGYGPRRAELYQRLAHLIARVLAGTPASELPIEQPANFELVLNLQTAKALGLTIPPTLLARADEVIE